MKVEDFKETNEDVFFLMYNTFNDFYIGLMQDSYYYYLELNDRAIEKSEIVMILFILSIISLVICFIILIPVVHSVN
jgi:hypothetical protein